MDNYYKPSFEYYKQMVEEYKKLATWHTPKSNVVREENNTVANTGEYKPETYTTTFWMGMDDIYAAPVAKKLNKKNIIEEDGEY